jgi:hypothetical protein
VERTFQPSMSMCKQEGFQPLRYVRRPQTQSTHAAEAWIFLDRSCRPEGLLHPIVNNAG